MFRLWYLNYLGEENPLYTSVNNGIFICELCAKIHIGLKKDVSFVRSISMDTWTDH